MASATQRLGLPSANALRCGSNHSLLRMLYVYKSCAAPQINRGSPESPLSSRLVLAIPRHWKAYSRIDRNQSSKHHSRAECTRLNNNTIRISRFYEDDRVLINPLLTSATSVTLSLEKLIASLSLSITQETIAGPHRLLQAISLHLRPLACFSQYFLGNSLPTTS